MRAALQCEHGARDEIPAAFVTATERGRAATSSRFSLVVEWADQTSYISGMITADRFERLCEYSVETRRRTL